MTGRTETAHRSAWSWLSRVLPPHCRYLAVDGGAGAHLLAELAGYNGRPGYLTPADSPRHANLLIVVGPVTRKLAPAIVHLAKALPGPAGALVISNTQLEGLTFAELVRPEELLPGSLQVEGVSAGQAARAALEAARQGGLQFPPGASPEPQTVSLPSREEQEMATEMAVLSLGPVNSLASGPLGLLLVCDGEQVARAEVEPGYAHRGIASAMTKSGWRDAADLASALDPLTPLAGKLAYVRAIESLQGYEPPLGVAAFRKAAVALERVQNYLWWAVRFFGILESPSLARRSWKLAGAVSAVVDRMWERPALEWVAPQRGAAPASQSTLAYARQMNDKLWAFYERVKSDRLLALRTRGVGVLPEDQLRQAGIEGPVLQTAHQYGGDVQGRLLARLEAAARDLNQAIDITSEVKETSGQARWPAPSGEAAVAVMGPRGSIGIRLASNGKDGPADVQWARPSAALLELVPQMLRGQKVADAEVILASLDLAMAEADG